MKKKNAVVTVVEGDKILINRGSLHEVDKRDIYKIYDVHGKYKGMLELRGVFIDIALRNFGFGSKGLTKFYFGARKGIAE